MNRSIPAALVLLVALLAGCSGEGADGSADAPSAVATTTVDLPKSYRFEPAAIQVDVGATVTWTNHDEFTHNVSFDGDAPLAMKPGETVTRAFPTAGTFAYLCSLHPREMQGSVAVAGA
jgi:plastocyanin